MEKRLSFALLYGAFAWTSLTVYYIISREVMTLSYKSEDFILASSFVLPTIYHLVRVSQITLTRDLPFVRCKWKYAYLISLVALVPWALISCVMLPWSVSISGVVILGIMFKDPLLILKYGWCLAPIATTMSIWYTYVLRKRHSARSHANACK